MDRTSDKKCSFREMVPQDGPAVGALHAKYLKSSILSDFGPDFLGPFYTALVKHEYGLGFMMTHGDDVVGYCFGRHSLDNSIAMVVLRSWRTMFMPLTRLVLRNPLTLFKILHRMRQSGHVECPPGVAEYMTMALEEDFRGDGNSVAITEMFFDQCRQRGCTKVRWETMGFNRRAQKFFVKIKGNFIGESEVDGEKVFWYERDLES
jgi:GNAT superfamily N-acetyltransferase